MLIGDTGSQNKLEHVDRQLKKWKKRQNTIDSLDVLLSNLPGAILLFNFHEKELHELQKSECLSRIIKIV